MTIAPEPPYDGYKTYLIRNNARDKQGILNNWIKAELVPERWGFDVVLPNGDRMDRSTYLCANPPAQETTSAWMARTTRVPVMRLLCDLENHPQR